MNELTLQDQELLRAELVLSHERLDGFARELRSVEAELEAHAGERQRNELLHEVCGALEKLDELDAADLFWGERASVEEGQGHVRLVRRSIDELQRRLLEMEGAREAILDKIRSEEGKAEIVGDDLFEAQLREEQKKLEWVTEREIGGVPDRLSIMPWARGGEDDERLRKSLGASLLVCLLLGVVLPLIDLPLPERWEPSEVPDRFASLIQERRLPPPKVEEAQPAEQKPKPIEDAPLLAEEGTPQPANDLPPKKSPASKGILAFREKFSGLAEHESIAQLGKQARISRAGEASAGRTQRSLVTTQAPGSSGGINLAALSRDVGGGGGQFEGVEVAHATSSIGGTGEGDRPLAGGPGSGRTDEEIQIVFDRHKAALYRLYNRELRKNPTLQGQMVLRLTIEADGTVSFCDLQSSDMKAPQLSAQVVARVRTFDFGAKEVSALTILYPIDFLPAT